MNARIKVDCGAARAALLILFDLRRELQLQLADSPISASGFEHLFPVLEGSVSRDELIKRLSAYVLFAFDAASVKECLKRLEVRVAPNEGIG